MEESVVQIELTKGPIFLRGQWRERFDGDGFSDWTKGVKSNLYPSLVFGNRTVWVAFDPEHPFTADGSMRRAWNKLLSAISEQGIELRVHGFALIRNFHGLSVGGGFKSGRKRM